MIKTKFNEDDLMIADEDEGMPIKTKFNEDDLMIVDEDEGMPWACPSFDS